jgi:hypothetical protein
MTDRQQVERLMAIVKQSREAQRTYFKNRKSAAPSHVETLLKDAKFKENSLDVLIAQLEKQGYQANKHEGVKPEQGNMFP